MKRIAVFGNAGGGKLTLARQLADIVGLPLHSVDTIKYKHSGDELSDDEYQQIHSELLHGDEWIFDGFGDLKSAWESSSVADTLIYVDLPLFTHYAWVTKRLAKGLFVTPEGWPEGSPMWRSSLNSYRALRLCHEKLTPRYRQLVVDQAAHKRVHHLRSPRT